LNEGKLADNNGEWQRWEKAETAMEKGGNG